MDDSIENLFFEVVESDDFLQDLRELLDSRADPNYQSTHGTTPLHKAALSRENNIKVVQELIKRGAEVDLSDHLSYTALHHAVINRKRSVVKELLQSGASVNAKCYLGETPLHLAILSYSSTTRYQADLWIIHYLFQRGDIDFNAKDSWGYTPLMLAIEEKQEMAALFLLCRKADPNACNNVSESPLHVAFHLPQSRIEFQLLHQGVSIYSVDKKGMTPLDVLIKYGLDRRDNNWIKLIFKFIAFKYTITSDLKQKLEHIPHLSQFFNKCCDEVDYMKSDFISGNVTMHDFLWNCFNENDFKYLLLQIHKPVIDRLVRKIYPAYFMEILYAVPEFSLLSILQMTACSKKQPKGKAKGLADMLSILDIIYLFSKYVWRPEIICLIIAFADMKISESMPYFQQPDLRYVFYLKSNIDITLHVN